MKGLVFDIETNGLLDELTRIHCIAIRDLSGGSTVLYEPDDVEAALDRLANAERIIGHNIMAFDIPAIQKVKPSWQPKGEVIDSLVLSRMAYLDLPALDAEMVARKRYVLTGKMMGSHSLEAWGIRLGFNKGDYAAEMQEKGLDPWVEYNRDMGEYCVNDVDLNTVLLDKVRSRGLPRKAVEMEHRLWAILLEQMSMGVQFDTQAAAELYAELSHKREEIAVKLREMFGWWWKGEKKKTPKRNNSRYGYIEGCPFTPVKRVDFNPASRDHIALMLTRHRGWKPKQFTPSGKPKIDEDVLGALDWPEAEMLTEYLTVDKRISQLAEGKGAWLHEVESDNRIYGRINPNGTITGRGAHFSPNLGQVPRTGNPYGKECRKLFIAKPGCTMVGGDLDALELRMLAHYMGIWDDGEYAEEVTEGDAHTANQKAAGLPDRDTAKTFFYALIYGGGDAKIGSIVGKGRTAGRRLKEKFFSGMPAMGNLMEGVKKAAKKRGYLKTINGVKIPVRSEHSALNTLLQSAGSVVTKQSIVNFHDLARQEGYTHCVDYGQVLWVHDEIQVECKPEDAETLGKLIVEAFRMTTDQFNLNCPMDGSYDIGPSWAETH